MDSTHDIHPLDTTHDIRSCPEAFTISTTSMSDIPTPLRRDGLFTMHQEQLRKGGSNAESTMAIVTILGGIDQILGEYLQHESIFLDDMQLHELQTIVTTQKKTLDTTTTIVPTGVRILSPHAQSVERTDIGDIRNMLIELSLETRNNFLFTLLSPSHYRQAMRFIHSRISKASVFITFLIWFALVATKIVLLWSIYIIVISIVFWLPYCTLYLLSVNKTAFRFMFHSFDFWIKFIYLFVWGVCELSHRFMLQRNNFDSTTEHVLSVCAYVLFDTVCIFATVMISVLDGFPSKQMWTIMLPGCIAVVTILYSMYYQFEKATGDDSIVSITDEYQFSLRGIMANAQRVIGIFYAKQTYFAWKYRQRATSINIKPTLQWILPRDSQAKHGRNHTVSHTPYS